MTMIFSNIWNIIKDPMFLIPVILIILIILIGSSYYELFQTKMSYTLFKFYGLEFDIWSLSHVLLYIYFGYMFPGFFVEFLIFGSIWELLESIYRKDIVRKILGCNEKNYNSNLVCRVMMHTQDCRYWYGKVDDIAVNMIGFVIGAYIAKLNGKTFCSKMPYFSSAK